MPRKSTKVPRPSFPRRGAGSGNETSFLQRRQINDGCSFQRASLVPVRYGPCSEWLRPPRQLFQRERRGLRGHVRHKPTHVLLQRSHLQASSKILETRKYLFFFVLRYSKGFGVLGDILGDDHPLNIRNSIYGIAFYICVTFLGNYRNLGRKFA